MSGLNFDAVDKLFVLGVERSGSTWLANILDSAPSVDLYMEPFAEVAGIVKGFPDRLSYLGEASAGLERRITSRLSELPDLKYYGPESPDSSATLRRFNWRLQESLGRISEAVVGRRSSGRRHFHELNLGRVSNPEVFGFDKHASPAVFAVKELRLNFKVRFLRSLFPDARFVVIVRNPLAQIDSIRRQLESDSLVYLRRFLDVLPQGFEDSRRLSPFAEAFAQVDDPSQVDRSLLYWFANYSVLIEDLQATGADYRVVRHEDLSRETTETVKGLFRFAGLDWTEQTAGYLEASTSADSGKDVRSTATETVRQTAGLVERSLNRIDEPRRRRFRQVAEPFWELAPEPVRAYRQWLSEATR